MRRILATIFSTGFCALWLVSAQTSSVSYADNSDSVNENPVTLQIHMEPTQVKRGGTAQILVDLTVAANHHAYKDMMKLSWLSADGVTIDTFNVQPAHTFYDKFSKTQREGVEDQGTFSAIMHFPFGMQEGPHQGKISFRYQVCSDRYCLFPKTVTMELPYTVKGTVGSNIGSTNNNGMSNDTAPDGSALNIADSFHRALARGGLWVFIFVFIAGFLTSLTPCIFPMIPITISIIGAGSLNHRKSKGFFLSICYVLGIATTYSLLGVAAASTGAFFGAALSNVYVVLAVALIFLAMGLSMLGLYEIQVPAVIRNKLGGGAAGSGFGGAFLAGLFAGIVASPCIGPVLVSILTYVAETARVFFGFSLLFVFALGMGVLFIVLGTFSSLVRKLPKAGPWMETVKIIFGLIFIAMALYYIWPVASHHNPFKSAATKSAVTDSGTTANPALSNSTGGIPWQPYSEELFSEALQHHKPVIIDFYADWCVACHELDHETYTDKAVIDESKDFVRLQVDATQPSDLISTLQKRYGIKGLPTVIFVDHLGHTHTELTITGFVGPKEFLGRMKKDL